MNKDIDWWEEDMLPFQPGTGLPAAPDGGVKDIFNPAHVELMAQPVSVNNTQL
jgi:hypothetical protein